MLDRLAIVVLAAALIGAAVQDVKSREVDIWWFAAGAVPAALLVYISWGKPMYFFSLGVGLLLALLMRILGSGYADSLALALISTAPPLVPWMPTAFLVIMAGSVLLPVQMAWLHRINSGRPCQMRGFEKLTHICVSRREYEKNPVKFIMGDVGDVERYKPPPAQGDWIKAKYGLPYLAYLALGFAIYMALYLS